MKHLARLTIVSIILTISSKAAPFMAVGDNAELFVTAAAMIQSDDNIYLGASGEDDTVFNFTPGVDLVFGKGSNTTGNVYFREEIRRYSSNSQQDTELANVGVTANYSNGLTKANFNASYAEVAQNQVGATLTSDIARRDVTTVGGKTEFSISEKTSLSVGLNFNKTAYVPVAFTDSDILSIPIDVYYEASPKLFWSLGYSYRNSKLSGSADDNQDHFLNLGARGEFTPKLTGQVKVGYTQRSFDRAGNQSLFGLDGSLAYQYSEKTNFNFTASNDFGNAGTGDSTKNFTLGASVTNKLTEQWSINAGLNRRSIDYPTRTDDYIEGNVGATYVYNSYVNFTASYIYRDNSSDSATSGSEFTNNVFALGANIRY